MTRDTDERGKLADRIDAGLSSDGEGFFAPPLSKKEWRLIAAALRAPAGHAEREALVPFITAAAGIPNSVSDAAPFARVPNDKRAPGTMRTITFGEFRRLIAAISNAPAPSEGARLSDDKLAGWARNWHWKDCADDKHVDPSIYFRDRRLLKAFIAEFVAPVRPAPADTEDQGPDTLGERP